MEEQTPGNNQTEVEIYKVETKKTKQRISETKNLSSRKSTRQTNIYPKETIDRKRIYKLAN